MRPARLSKSSPPSTMEMHVAAPSKAMSRKLPHPSTPQRRSIAQQRHACLPPKRRPSTAGIAPQTHPTRAQGPRRITRHSRSLRERRADQVRGGPSISHISAHSHRSVGAEGGVKAYILTLLSSPAEAKTAGLEGCQATALTVPSAWPSSAATRWPVWRRQMCTRESMPRCQYARV